MKYLIKILCSKMLVDRLWILVLKQHVVLQHQTRLIESSEAGSDDTEMEFELVARSLSWLIHSVP